MVKAEIGSVHNLPKQKNQHTHTTLVVWLCILFYTISVLDTFVDIIC